MTETVAPHFFDGFAMQRVSSDSLDAELGAAGPPVTILFLWGRDCPNCDLAKAEMLLVKDRFVWPEVRWLHGNVYEDPDLGTRFGLHGIPTFIVFRGSRRMGRISPWPGGEAFRQAIGQQIAALGAPEDVDLPPPLAG